MRITKKAPKGPRGPKRKMTAAGQTSLRFEDTDLKWLQDYAWSIRLPLSALVRMVMRDFIKQKKEELRLKAEEREAKVDKALAR